MELGQRSQVCHLLVSTRTCLSRGATHYWPGSTGVGDEVAGEEQAPGAEPAWCWQPALAALTLRRGLPIKKLTSFENNTEKIGFFGAKLEPKMLGEWGQGYRAHCEYGVSPAWQPQKSSAAAQHGVKALEARAGCPCPWPLASAAFWGTDPAGSPIPPQPDFTTPSRLPGQTLLR